MAVHVDSALPVHPLTVSDLERMVEARIVEPDDPIELLDGVLVEKMSPQSERHNHALMELTMLAVAAVAPLGLRVAVQMSLDVGSPISLPEPDLAIVPPATADRRASGALLVVEISVSSRRVDLGPKASVYARAGIPEYWVLDVERRELVVHREPSGSRYEDVRRRGADETVTAVAVALTLPVSGLL